MKRTIIKLFCISLFCLPASGQHQHQPVPPKPPAKRIVTAAQVNGVYRFDKNEFRILALGKQKLTVQFDGIYPTPKSFNTGYAAGFAIIDGNIATFKPDENEPCEITIVFLPGKIKVMQSGRDVDCGFGHNVYATGTYKKIRGGKPKFQSPP